MSALYAALLRRTAGQSVQVGQHWVDALTMIRALLRDEALADTDKVTECLSVLDALSAVQAELDTREA